LAARALIRKVTSTVSEYEVLERIDAFCDALPRQRATAEVIGPLVLFVLNGPGWPYYARPLGRRSPASTVSASTVPISAADVRRVRARQRELLIPESFEWIEQATPDMAAAASGAGLDVHRHPLMLLTGLVPPRALPPRVSVRIVSPDDPELVLAWATPGVAFGHPGMAVGRAGVTERDKLAADHDASVIGLLRERLESGESVLAAVIGPNGPLAAGSYQLAGGVAEITGVGVLPASRRRGLGAAVTAALAAHATASGAEIVFLSATDESVARVYSRLGFRRIGTAMIADPPEG
jgi:ribosomal protein S18 acetylase RimI-like enzyme